MKNQHKPPPRVKKAIRMLGENLRIARLRRQMKHTDVSERSGVSVRTVQKLESGHAGVSIGNLGRVLLAMGEVDQLSAILRMSENDIIGDMESVQQLPKRIRTRKPPSQDRVTEGEADDGGIIL